MLRLSLQKKEWLCGREGANQKATTILLAGLCGYCVVGLCGNKNQRKLDLDKVLKSKAAKEKQSLNHLWMNHRWNFYKFVYI